MLSKHFCLFEHHNQPDATTLAQSVVWVWGRDYLFVQPMVYGGVFGKVFASLFEILFVWLKLYALLFNQPWWHHLKRQVILEAQHVTFWLKIIFNKIHWIIQNITSFFKLIRLILDSYLHTHTCIQIGTFCHIFWGKLSGITWNGFKYSTLC